MFLPGPEGRKSRSLIFIILLLGTFILLLLHSLSYRFLTDDAFISFRYAHNLAHGDGLVFNPGFEKVEGYTNFLWVMILALFDAVRIPPETASIFLSLALTAVLWGLLFRFARRLAPSPDDAVFIFLPLLFLALTRSIAVWSTSGLETRLFEVLILAGALALIRENAEDSPPWFSWSALGFAMATLTRPDGLLLSAMAFGAALLDRILRRRVPVGRLAAHCATFVFLVGGHFLFRRAYYGEWLPNTYYAKVGGELWWSMGWKYLGMFILEYGIYLWVPLLVPAYLYLSRRGQRFIFFLTLALILPHMLYIISIGGDHFEYRPLDLYFPFLFILIVCGFQLWRNRARWTWLPVAYLVLVIATLIGYPWLSHRYFPDTYTKGFPGLWIGKLPEADAYLAFPRCPILKAPLAGNLHREYVRLFRDTTASFVGVRQEEHRLFLATMREEADIINRLIAQRRLPSNAYIAISGVGAIPYYTDLRILDRQGLTDAHVAHSEFSPGRRIMAHGKLATLEYARERGVDFWAYDPVHTFLPVTHPMFFWYVQDILQKDIPAYTTSAGEGYFMLVLLPQGSNRTLSQFPNLGLKRLNSPEALKEIGAEAVRVYRARLEKTPSDVPSRLSLAAWLQFSGDPASAIPIYESLLRTEPFRPEIYRNLALAYHANGQDAQVRELLTRGVTLAESAKDSIAAEAFRELLKYLNP
jgi:arabinofuranosyltransferase